MTATCFLLFACAMTASQDLAYAQTDEMFESMVLDKLEALERNYTKLVSENEQLRAMVSTGSVNKRQTRSVPLFEVAFSASVSSHLPDLLPNQTVVFDNVLTNVGGFYDETTGELLIPKTGTYLIFANILSERDESIETEILVDGIVIAEIYSGKHKHHGNGGNLAIAHLDEGSSVWVNVHNRWGTMRAIHCCWSSFSGYLLH